MRTSSAMINIPGFYPKHWKTPLYSIKKDAYEGWVKVKKKRALYYYSSMFGSFPVPPLVKLQKEMFKNCSHGNFHVGIVVKICSAVHADTF